MAGVDYKTRTREINTALEKVSVGFRDVASKGFNLEQSYRIYYTAISRSPKLMQCTTESLARCLVDAASLGLYIGSTLGQCYPVPFRNKNLKPPIDHEAQFMLGYQGMCELVRRSGEVESISAEIVYEKDFYRHQKGTNPILEHIPFGYDPKDAAAVLSGKFDRGKPIFGYAVAQFKGGGVHVETMTIDQIEKRRARSRASGDGPWVTDWLPMARKTMIRAIFPFLPKTPDLIRAMAMDDRVEMPDVKRLEIPGADVTEAVDVDAVDQTEADKLVEELLGAPEPKKVPVREPQDDAPPPPQATTKKRRGKASSDTAQTEIVAPGPSTELEGEPDEPITDASDIEVPVEAARSIIHEALSKMDRAHSNLLAHQFNKKHGAGWTESEDVQALEDFYEEIEDMRKVLAGA